MPHRDLVQVVSAAWGFGCTDSAGENAGVVGTQQFDAQRLAALTKALRDEIEQATLPLDLPETMAARTNRARLLAQLDDYLLPRLHSLDAPLLAVVGGSTGAGKSTLVNSLIGREVTTPGVLRPTTRSPVLIHHLAESAWFSDQRILPSLARVTGETSRLSKRDKNASDDSGTLRLVGINDIPPGLALLDAPDIDSVVAANRDLADQLLLAADLWIFVTTAARYADAVPWALLRQAAERGTSVAIILDRVPPSAVEEIQEHLADMLAKQGLHKAPIFTITECELRPDGLLPESQTEPLRLWLGGLARDAGARSEIVRQTLSGALDSLELRTHELVQASRTQAEAQHALNDSVDAAYDKALKAVEEGAQDGTLLRGEILARWQEFVGTGEFFKQVESTVSRLRDRLVSAIKGEPPTVEPLGEALQSGVEALISSNAQAASAAITRDWRAQPAGQQVLATDPTLSRPSPNLDAQVAGLVREWQSDILTMVRSEGKDRRTTARVMAYGVNGLGVMLMLVTFASTAGITGAEVGIAGGTAVIGQKVLEAIFGDQAVRELARKARERLVEKVTQAYAAEHNRYAEAVAKLSVRDEQAARLAKAAAMIEAAR